MNPPTALAATGALLLLLAFLRSTFDGPHRDWLPTYIALACLAGAAWWEALT